MVPDTYYELLLEKEGSKAESVVMNALRQTDLFKVCYAYKSRVKPEHKLVEKVVRKRKKKPEYKLIDITDIVGIRLVTLFRIDMPLVFEKVLDIISHVSELNPNPFKANSIEEIKVFSTNQHDEIIYKICEIVKGKAIETEVLKEFSSEGYSSIHVVARFTETVQKPPEIINYHIPIEIQIRTVFEDAWGEVDHKYGYVIRTGKELGNAVANPDSVLRHLKVMKKFADACGEYADAIHIEATAPAGCDVDPARLISVGPDDALKNQFVELGVPLEDVSVYFSAREKREHAESEEGQLKSKGFKVFLEAAEMFRELAEKYPESEIQRDNKKDYLFYYYIKMNEALCLMSANDKERVTAALHIYQHIETMYPDFLLVKMRLAQAFVKNKYYDLAISKYEELDNELKKMQESEIIYGDNLPKLDYDHIVKRLPTIYGYALWRKSITITSSSEPDIASKTFYIKKAYELAETVLVDSDKETINKYNNLLYYGLELLQHCESYQIVTPISDLREKLNKHLEDLKGKCDLDQCKDVDILDTMLHAYDFLEDKDGVLSIVGKVIPICEKALETAPSDREIILDVEKFAIELKQKYDC